MAKVLISMQEDFLEKVDELASAEQRTRSELIRQALRVYIRRRGRSSEAQIEATLASLSAEDLSNLLGDV
ncbi:MAG: ribbon-helix-helix domain-containing protein [Vampirovibrionales bacterium]|nr:ribbon-helix-helix domain-containing protein [Vampirovibrionales bacterium]